MDGETRPITRDDVIACYKAFLGRLPESEGIVEQRLASEKPLDSLLREFLTSAEFNQRRGLDYASGVAAAFHAPNDNDIEHSVSPRVMEQIVDRIVAQWTAIGETEPYWGVLSNDEFKRDNIDAAMEKFYASGASDVANVVAFCARNQVAMPKGVCLELGCGAGRITRWLAEKFERVVGYDVAAPMLKLAETRLAAEGRSNCDLRQLRRPADLERAESCDLFFSVIVLQHNPPPVIKQLLKSALWRLRSGGVFYFQVPTHFAHYRFRAQDYLARNETEKGAFEMHALPMGVVMDIIHDAGCRVKEVVADNAAGGPGSHTFLG